ncbi:MFS transporter [Embleya scabrispora]|uniref:MFS transporter n=1 Tax=Embleya scabrispora TaxID=159449 RepID=A0A1T3P6Q0_9ACTN|nr:MFS transporter [Embleya scabrispora]OPC84723.1 MFS transporter [Embleya scabrispora]
MRWWSLGNLVSNLGTWMQLTVQNLLVLHLTGSAAATGLSLSVQAAPGLLFGVVGGRAVDAWPRKWTAGVSQAALAMIAFSTALLFTFGLLSVPALLILAALTGLIATVDGPACALLGNDLVPREDVPSAIALGAVVHSVGRLAGTALAGVTVAFFGMGAAYVANGVSFLFVSAIVPFLKPIHVPKPGPESVRAPGDRPRRGSARSAASGSAREGLAFFAGRPRLVALAAIAGLGSTLGRNYGLTLAVLVTGPLGGGPGAFGVVSTMLAVGGILGALLAGRLRRPSVRTVAFTAAAGGALQIAAGLTPTLFVLALLVVPMALAESISDTATTAILQTDPPEHMRGRVLGVWNTVGTGWQLLGPPTLGLLLQCAGARGALVLGGVVIAGVIAAAGLAHDRRTARTARTVALPRVSTSP